jgi:hypothetical protein
MQEREKIPRNMTNEDACIVRNLNSSDICEYMKKHNLVVVEENYQSIWNYMRDSFKEFIKVHRKLLNVQFFLPGDKVIKVEKRSEYTLKLKNCEGLSFFRKGIITEKSTAKKELIIVKKDGSKLSTNEENNPVASEEISIDKNTEFDEKEFVRMEKIDQYRNTIMYEEMLINVVTEKEPSVSIKKENGKFEFNVIKEPEITGEEPAELPDVFRGEGNIVVTKFQNEEKQKLSDKLLEL